jgi:hypothetical protein
MRTALTTLLLALAAPAAPAKVELRDVQAAHGYLGPQRTTLDYLPGDEVFFRFTVAGATVTDDGRLNGELRMTLRDAAGKVLFQDAAEVRKPLPFGGGRFPAKAALELGHQFPPGEYAFAVEYRDLASGESDSFTRKCTVRPTEFGLARVRFAHDEAGTAPARAGGVAGQPLHLKLVAVGFDRAKGEIDLAMDVQVLDENGRPLSPAGVRAAVRNADPETVKAATHVTFTSEMVLSRPGRFTLRVTVTDRQTGKVATFETPLRVTE